jgi:GNAT superfamily N-acetyltransferase
VVTEIRTLHPDEWEMWRDLRLRSLADSPDAFGSTLEREQGFTERDWLDRLASMPVVAFVDRTPAAMGGGYRIRPGWVQVVAMWTDPVFRGRGLARLVLAEIVRTARAENRRLVLDVARGNSAARTAYEHFGFVATGQSAPLREDSDLLVDQMVLPADPLG